MPRLDKLLLRRNAPRFAFDACAYSRNWLSSAWPVTHPSSTEIAASTVDHVARDDLAPAVGQEIAR
jgi:hypothetical protein